MDEVFSSWPDLTNQPISNPDVEYFTDDSSFVWDGTYFARYELVTLNSIVEACPLPIGTSAQKAELVALMGTLACCRSMSKHLHCLHNHSCP
jgi:hypothetical protein